MSACTEQHGLLCQPVQNSIDCYVSLHRTVKIVMSASQFTLIRIVMSACTEQHRLLCQPVQNSMDCYVSLYRTEWIVMSACTQQHRLLCQPAQNSYDSHVRQLTLIMSACSEKSVFHCKCHPAQKNKVATVCLPNIE